MGQTGTVGEMRLGLVASAGMLFLQAVAQRHVSADKAAIIYAMEPVWGGLIGWLAGEAMSAGKVGGAALIVASVLLSQLSAHKATHAPA